MINAALRSFVFAGMSLLAMSAEALADKRVALVVGNSAYQNVAKLPNPSNDAASVAEMLKKAGFDVVSLQQDAGNLEFKRAIRRFEDNARDADVAVVFYAGHGIEIGGTNYMIPVDAKLASDLDAQDEAIPLDRIVESVESASKLKLVILDACRDNPFVANMKRQRTALRSLSSGLSKVEPTSSDTLIAYAAKAGSTADDGVGAHSPFTTAILNNLTTPGLDIRLAFGRIRDEVMKSTSQRQEPFVYGSLGGSTVSLVPDNDAAKPATVVTNDPNSDARRDYEYFERVGTKDAWDAFLKMYRTGPYADLARAQRAKLAAADTSAARPGDQRSATQGTPATPATPAISAAPAAPVVAAATPSQTPAATTAPLAGPAPGEVARMLQTELARVGCYSGSVDGQWNTSSRRALDGFNRAAKTKLDTKSANLDALYAVRDKQSRVCPLECDRGSRADGDTCVKIACDAGSAPNDKGNCEPIRNQPQTTTRTPAAEPRRQAPFGAAGTAAGVGAGAAAAAQSRGGGGQMACDRFGCKAVGRGCHVETTTFREETQQTVVCP